VDGFPGEGRCRDSRCEGLERGGRRTVQAEITLDLVDKALQASMQEERLSWEMKK